MGRLFTLLEGCNLGDRETDDVRIWIIDEEKGFSVKSMYRTLSPTGHQLFPSSYIWNIQGPPKFPLSCGSYGGTVSLR